MSKVKYLSKDFGQFRTNLINHAKSYFPNTYKDFNESSPGMMIIEMASFVGDILSLYGDHQLQESFINLASERKNIYNLSQNYGYKPNNIVPARVELTIMQLVPAMLDGQNYVPNMDYAFHIKEGMTVKTKDDKYFYTIESCNFNINSVASPTNVNIYEISNTGEITYFILSKKVKAIAGSTRTEEYEFTDPRKYDKIVINEENVSQILSVEDDNNEKWYEVDFLSQDLVPIAIKNDRFATDDLHAYNESVPYILCYFQTDRRYITRLRKDNKFEIQFGSGIGLESDEEVLPNPFNVAIGIDYYRRYQETSIDPVNFINTKTYGSVPQNTTLTVKYLVSNGIDDNVSSETITIIENMEFYPMLPTLDSEILTTLKYSNDRGIKVSNEFAAYGGANSKPLDIIKNESTANFAAQNRAVTKEDYILRCYAMPAHFGSIAKAYIEQDEQISQWNNFDKIPNPYALNLYLLGYDNEYKFVNTNEALKNNIRRYLSMYRLMTDAINIKDAFIINVGINFEIICRPSYNSNDVIIRCIDMLKDMFHQTKMEINHPIILSKVYTELDKIEGVQTVSKVEFYNKYETEKGYSGNIYDINTATRDGIIYPSLDASIFEIKFPDRDIKGKTINI